MQKNEYFPDIDAAQGGFLPVLGRFCSNARLRKFVKSRLSGSKLPVFVDFLYCWPSPCAVVQDVCYLGQKTVLKRIFVYTCLFMQKDLSSFVEQFPAEKAGRQEDARDAVNVAESKGRELCPSSMNNKLNNVNRGG